MIKFQRVWALVLRYMLATRDPTRITEFIFWPMIDIGFLGLLASWAGGVAGEPQIIKAFVTGLVLWQVAYRANYEVCVNIMDEFLEQNLANLIASPLKKMEWIFAMMLSGLMKITFTLMFGAFISWLFFSINIFNAGFALIPFVFLCLLTGWMIGFVGGGILIYKGSKLQQLPWVVITIAAIFSAIIYPIDILPHWMRVVAEALPMSYIFQCLRGLIAFGTLSVHYLMISLLLNLFYLSLSLSFFFFMFDRSRQRGLARLN